MSDYYSVYVVNPTEMNNNVGLIYQGAFGHIFQMLTTHNACHARGDE